MWVLIAEACIIGIITSIIGKITFNLTTNKKNENNNINKPLGIEIAFFITGCLLHIIIEAVGLNKWYCQKKCMTGIKLLCKDN